VLRRIFGSEREEVVGGWRRLHNEEFHNLIKREIEWEDVDWSDLTQVRGQW
jgi:hypothetical protein